MIDTLHIKNIGIIDDLSVNFSDGFNVLTGETGAGKTLIIDSLALLAGGRFSKDIIRTGEKNSIIEANILVNDDYVIVSREMNINGKNLCKIDGRMVTVNELKEYMKNIINIHGQHDNQIILDKSKHIEYVDKFAGSKLLKIRKEYEEEFNKRNIIKNELEKNYGDDKERQRKLDLLKYQLNEIESAKLKIGEDKELEEKRKMIMNKELIKESLNKSDYEMSEVTFDSLGNVIKCIEKIEEFDKKYSEILGQVRDIYYQVEEISRDLSNLKDDGYFEEDNRQEIEERLDLIFSLKRKYGDSIEDILKYSDELKKEIYDIENLEEHNNELKKQLEIIDSGLLDRSRKMHEIRIKVSEDLENKITEELKDLEMKNAKFKVNIEYEEDGNFNKTGLDKIEFLISTNVGDSYKELVKIASGGEMSRIMLGIKNILSDVDEVPVLVFDEIDTGISGIAANRVADKLKKIAKKHQVLCITHLAVIAAKGEKNYYVSKNVVNNRTTTCIKQLDENEVLEEIARIASGEITEVSLEHARELRKRS